MIKSFTLYTFAGCLIAALFLSSSAYGFSLKEVFNKPVDDRFQKHEVIKNIQIKHPPNRAIIKDIRHPVHPRHPNGKGFVIDPFPVNVHVNRGPVHRAVEGKIYQGDDIVNESMDEAMRYKGYYTDGSEPLFVLDTVNGEVIRYTKRGVKRVFAHGMRGFNSMEGRFELVLRPGSRVMLVDMMNEVLYIRDFNKQWVAPGQYKRTVIRQPHGRFFFRK